MNKKLKKVLAITLCLTLTFGMSTFAFAEETTETIKENAQTPPEMPNGEMPPERPEGEMPGNMQGGGRGDKNGMGGNKFTDVAEDAWYSEYVNFVSMRGIMKGKDGAFRPLDTTTRAEYVLALYNAAGAPEITESCSFTDVSADAEYVKAVAWAETNGIASGTGDGTFMPDGSLTREMAMTFLYRALSALNLTADIPAESVISVFSDNTVVSSWALDAMNTLVNMGVISGTDEGKLNPQGNLVNAEVATMIYRALGGDKIQGGMPEGMGQDRQPGNKGEMPEMSEEEKAARIEQMTAELTAKLDAGEISQEEYDEMIAKIEAGDFMFGGRGGKGENPPAPPEENTEVTE